MIKLKSIPKIRKAIGLLTLAVGLAGTSLTQAATVQVTSSIGGTMTWYATNEYVLNGQIYVLSNAVLIIQPGTVVRGKPGDTNNYAALFVTRDGKLFAEGERTKPIIFTAEADDLNDPEDLLTTDAGLWGGIVLLGNSVLNTATDLAGNGASPKYDLYEGLSDIVVSNQNVNRYGGNNDGDSSGVLRYVSIRHGGTLIKQDKEINGLSLCAVGSNTVVEYIEVIANADDGFEWFGGTVNTKYLVSAFNQDEQFDIDQGFRGHNQFWFGIHNPGITEFGGEWNGEPNTFAVSNTPLAKFEIYNMTLIGGGNAGRALRVRDYAAPQVYNAIWTEFPTQGARVDNPGAVFFTNGTIRFQETLWHNIGASSATFSNYVFDALALSNVFANPLLTGISRSNNFGLDPRPTPASPALVSSVTAPAGAFTPVAYTGAFDGSVDWAVQWTALGEFGIMSPKGGTQVVPQPTAPAVVPPAPPTMTIVNAGGTVDVIWTTQSGYSYQLQLATNLSVPIFWADQGSAQPGTGGSMTNTVPSSATEQYFQVKAF